MTGPATGLSGRALKRICDYDENVIPRRKFPTPLLAAVLWLAAPVSGADSTELVLGISPLLGESETRAQFQPLCTYLTATTQHPCRIVAQPNFLAYWEAMRRNQSYNLLFDDAHFTDYRVQKMKYTVLAKLPYTVTYSLAVPRNVKIHDPARLVGRRIATLGIPSMGAALLNGLFPQASKQPIPVEVDHADEAFSLLREGKVESVILPTQLIRQEMLRGANLRVLLSTAPIPHMGLSASPDLPPAVRDQIRSALLNAQKSEAGRSMLAEIGAERFDPANATVYKGHGRILQQYWGY